MNRRKFIRHFGGVAGRGPGKAARQGLLDRRANELCGE